VLFNEYWSLENMEISSITFKNILKNRLDGYSKENGVLVGYIESAEQSRTAEHF